MQPHAALRGTSFWIKAFTWMVPNFQSRKFPLRDI